MGKLVTSISEDGSVVATALIGTDIAAEIERIHKSSAVVTAALGRLAIGTAMMGYMLKGENDIITLRLKGGGPTGMLIATANSKGDVKAYVENPIVELPLNQYGKLDVRSAVGTDGFLSVVKDLGLKEPYVGQTPIVSGEIAEDITQYYAVSEQTPTVCGLGVLVNPDLTVKAAGGYIVQLLPFCDEKCIDIIEDNLKDIKSVSAMVAEGMSPQEICELLLKGLSPNVLNQAEIEYKCDCSRERVERALISMGEKELNEIIEEDGKCDVDCHFCNKKYHFNSDELNQLLNRQKTK